MMCLIPDAFAYFLTLIGPEAVMPTEGGLMLGIQEPTFWFLDTTKQMWCAPDVPLVR